jgi:hypothetical protein
MYSVKSSDKLSSSGMAYTGECILTHMLIGTDGVNDPTITIYDGVDNTGIEKVPTTSYDASALGLNGFTLSFPFEFKTGIYVEITCGGTVEVICGYKERDLWGIG